MAATATARECGHVMALNVSQRCHFVTHNPDCQHSNEGLFQYTQIFFCSFQDDMEGKEKSVLAHVLHADPLSPYIVGLLLIFVWLFFLFMILATAAENYLCPNLSAISNHLG